MTDAWRRARRILAVRLDAMGDVLMTEPALRALSGGGEREVTLLTSPAGAAVAPLLPGVREAIAYSPPWMKATPRRGDARAEFETIERLRAGRYDAAVIFTVHTQSALPAAMLCYLAEIPLRAAHSRDKPYQLLTDWISDPEPEIERHEVERQLALVGQLGFRTDDERMCVRTSDAAHLRARRHLSASGLDVGRPWIALHPGASAPSRRYPLDRYASALRMLADDGWQVAIVGGPDDAEAVAELDALTDRPSAVRVLTGDLEVEALAAIIGEASLFIGNNSGPGHLAAAVGTPSVILYALTNPQHTPWRVASRVLSNDVPCRNCQRSVCPMGHQLCLRGVGPERIVAAVRELAREPLRVAEAV